MITIAELVERASRRHARRVAVVDGSRSLTFAEVGDRSARLANALVALSPSAGSRVAVLLGNRLEFIEIDFAIARAGKVKAPINPRLTDDERSYILANCAAEVLFTSVEERDRVEAMRRDLPELRHVVYLDAPGAYEDLLAGASPSAPSVAVDLDAPSMILHTSGTTGRPKGATTSQRARVSSLRNMLLDEFCPTIDDGMVHVAPMSHGSGSKILAYFSRGARNVTIAKFEPATFFDAVERSGGTGTFVVPTMIRMLLDAPARAGADLSGIRNITYGGAPMPVALAEEAIEAFGPVLTQVYGSCEAPHPVTVLSRSDHLVSARLGSAGFPSSGVRIRLVDESGTEVERGGHGELQIQGGNVMSGYWEDPGATEAAFTDGWYRSGDVATLDDAGLVTIVGREREMLISGGLNVYPAEVEAVLHRHDGISEAAVFGVPDDLWGEVVAAAIVKRRGRTASESDIVQHCTGSLAGYKLPRRIFFVDELPKGTTGKVSKSDLVELASRGTAR